MAEVVLKTDLSSLLPFVSRGKVREIWQIDEEKLLFVATDRISAYDVILSDGVPRKGSPHHVPIAVLDSHIDLRFQAHSSH